MNLLLDFPDTYIVGFYGTLPKYLWQSMQPSKVYSTQQSPKTEQNASLNTAAAM